MSGPGGSRIHVSSAAELALSYDTARSFDWGTNVVVADLDVRRAAHAWTRATERERPGIHVSSATAFDR